MKNIVGYLVLGLLILVGVAEVVVVGGAIYRHETEPQKEVEKVDYHDSAIVVGEYMILQNNGWTTH